MPDVDKNFGGSLVLDQFGKWWRHMQAKNNTENKQGRLRLRKIEMDYEWKNWKKLAKFFKV